MSARHSSGRPQVLANQSWAVISFTKEQSVLTSEGLLVRTSERSISILLGGCIRGLKV
jgi:hypothetical protein